MGDDVLAALITAAAGFLIAVLWFDLMFDVQVWRYRVADPPPEVLESISAYYRRVTNEASPMGRLVAVVMLLLLVALVVQAAGGDVDWWVSAVSLPAALLAIGLAMGRIFGQARRLGSRADAPPEQAGLARSILLGHLVCLAAMVALLCVQIAAV